MCLLLMLAMVSKADGFKDFGVIVNNDKETLLTADEQAQGTAVSFGVAVADDGTVSRVAADDASAVATVSGKFHSEHGCTELKVVVPNATNVKITVGQCTYSGSTITVTDANGKEVATKAPNNPGCWKNDKKNVDVLYYQGEATTLTITGMTYCPYVGVSALTEEEIAALNASYTLTYYGLDGSVIGTQEAKGQQPIGAFAYGEKDVNAPIGVVFRGWFESAAGGKKFKVEDLVEGDMSLYAVATPMEFPDSKSTFAYNLADPNFDPTDHECIDISDGGYYYNTHGWTFGPGQTMKLWVSDNATISIGGCAYSSGEDIVITDQDGNTVGTVSGKNDTDGGINTFEYKGNYGTLTLTFGGRDYIHSVSIANHSKATTTDVNAEWSWQNNWPTSLASVHIEGTTGTVASSVEGIELFVDATNGKLASNGDNVQFNKGTILRVPVVSSNDIVTVIAHPYNFTEIKIGGNIYNSEYTEYKASAVDAANGYVEVEATTNIYLYGISVQQKAPKGLAELDNEPVTATFAFNLGTEDQKADFGEASDYFVTSKVTWGSNLFIKGLSMGLSLSYAYGKEAVIDTSHTYYYGWDKENVRESKMAYGEISLGGASHIERENQTFIAPWNFDYAFTQNHILTWSGLYRYESQDPTDKRMAKGKTLNNAGFPGHSHSVVSGLSLENNFWNERIQNVAGVKGYYYVIEAEDDGPDVFDGAVFYKQLDHRAGEEDQGGVGAQVESCDLGGDGGTDVGAHDHADGLGQRHQTGVDKADDHHVRGGGTLDQKGHQDPDDHRDKAVRGGALQNGAKLIAGGQLETGGHHTHSVQKQAYTAKQRKKFEYSHKKAPYSFFKDCWYRSTAL